MIYRVEVKDLSYGAYEKQERNIVANSREITLKASDVVDIRCENKATESLSFNPSVEVDGSQLTYQLSNRALAHWLSIGEEIGAWSDKIRS